MAGSGLGRSQLSGPRTSQSWARSAAAGALALACCASAQAQQASRPTGIDPHQAEKQIDAIQFDRSRAKQQSVPLPSVTGQPQSEGQLRPFRLRSVEIVGAAAIPADELTAIYRPYLGRTATQRDLQAIANAITDAYRRAGYFLSRAIIPPQHIRGGQVRIRVIEGRLASLAVKGNGATEFGVTALLQPLKNEHPLRLASFERQLMLANATPGVRIVDTSMEEIGTGSGAFKLVVTVESGGFTRPSG